MGIPTSCQCESNIVIYYNNTMKFAIVIPTYNGATYIEEALLSALNQTRKPDVIIVSDDNSTDDTLEICSCYKDIVRICKNENGPSGFVEGWNNAIRLVEDGFVAILHQDDLLAPTFLEEIEKAINLHPDVKHFFVPCNYIDSNGAIKREPDYCDGTIHRYSGIEYADAYRTIGCPHIHRCPGVVTHKSIFAKCQYRSEAGHVADDDFFYRVGQYTDVVGILKPLASYREHEKSETGHLANIKLVSRLANDYIYQAEQSKKNKCISVETYNYFAYWAEFYVFQEFVYSLLNNDSPLQKTSFKHKRILKRSNIPIPIKHYVVYSLSEILGRNVVSLLLKMFL